MEPALGREETRSSRASCIGKLNFKRASRLVWGRQVFGQNERSKNIPKAAIPSRMKYGTFEGASLQLIGPATAPVVIAIHGFADDSTAFTSLAKTPLTKAVRLVLCDLPGFGKSPRQGDARISDLAAFVLRLADALSPIAPVGLIAHSVGSTIGVEAAHRRPDRIRAILSIEGNLTPPDAYFSGKAAKFNDANSFKAQFCYEIAEMAKRHRTMRRYRNVIKLADAVSMWELGQDAARLGVGNRFGTDYHRLADHRIETLYLWGRHNTPIETARFIDENQLPSYEFSQSGHWKSVDAPLETGAIARTFFAENLTLQ
jgi:pimeloyl-ACP methyl ester carboxylesterase